jgi:hypothetical protein
VVEHLRSKNEALSSNPSTTKKLDNHQQLTIGKDVIQIKLETS